MSVTVVSSLMFVSCDHLSFANLRGHLFSEIANLLDTIVLFAVEDVRNSLRYVHLRDRNVGELIHHLVVTNRDSLVGPNKRHDFLLRKW